MSKGSAIQILEGKSVILGEYRNATFVSVKSSISHTNQTFYAVSSDGLLCQFNKDGAIIKTVSLKVKSCFSISVSENHVVCSSEDGIVRFDSNSCLLNYRDNK